MTSTQLNHYRDGHRSFSPAVRSSELQGEPMTLELQIERWKQTPEDLRRLSIDAPHRQTRERFSWLYEITRSGSAATAAEALGVHHQTMLKWLHRYNDSGPEAVVFVHTGGRRPFLTSARSTASKPSSKKATAASRKGRR